jgi:hypothetical protein
VSLLLDGDEDPISVTFDVKPGTGGNPVNPSKDVEIPVAILSTNDFYAPILHLFSSSTFISFGNPDIRLTRGFDPKVKDVNGDGLRDLVVKFLVAETGIACGNPTEMQLTGGHNRRPPGSGHWEYHSERMQIR